MLPTRLISALILDFALAKASEYIRNAAAVAERLKKPLVNPPPPIDFPCECEHNNPVP